MARATCPERQQTLRGAIDWSYDLLEEADRKLFDRFSVFVGGAFLTQAEPVCGPPPELGTDVLDGLSSLADKSLVRGTPTIDQDPRFVMLATIREYGQEKLAGDGDLEDLRRRHANTFLALTEMAEPHLTGAEAARWLDRLELDHDNLRLALDWATEMDEAQVAFRLIAALWRFWQIRGHIYEARMRVDRVLAMPGATTLDAKTRALGFGAGGSVCYWQADFPTSNHYYRMALEAARESGDAALVAGAVYNLSFAPIDRPPESRRDILGASIPYLEEAEALYEQIGDRRGFGDANWALGFALLTEHRFEEAERHGQVAFEIARESNDPFRIGWTGHISGSHLANRGDLVGAEKIFRQAMGVFRKTGDQGGIAMLLLDYALLAELRGDVSRYWRLGGAMEGLRERSGIGMSDIAFFDVGVNDFFWHLPVRPTDPAGVADWEAGKRLSPEQAVELALSESATPAVAS